jgi:hypothetical protein
VTSEVSSPKSQVPRSPAFGFGQRVAANSPASLRSNIESSVGWLVCVTGCGTTASPPARCPHRWLKALSSSEPADLSHEFCPEVGARPRGQWTYRPRPSAAVEHQVDGGVEDKQASGRIRARHCPHAD